MAFATGDILVLPFPYSDQLAEKRRPAVVVSLPELEETHGLIWVAMITSDRRANRMDDVPITDLGTAGLSAPSLVRPTKIATIEPSRVIRVAGALSATSLAQVRACLMKYTPAEAL